MRKFLTMAGFLLVAFAGHAMAQGRDANEKSLNSELARDRAETRIDRLRQDQRLKEDRAQPRAQKLPGETNTRPQQQQPQR
jgi:hypothetical protein